MKTKQVVMVNVQGAVVTNMKKTILLILAFVAYTIIIKTCPAVTAWDKSVIIFIQEKLSKLPLYLPLLPDCKLYSLMIAIPLIGGSIYFFRKKEWLKAGFICSIPLVTFLLNCIIKPIIQRPRPPFELQQVIHPDSFSYVSSHSLVTMALYGMIIYYFYKNCSNNTIKYSVITISVLWILFVGLSRIWLGVHNPTDVIGAYLLGFILLQIYSTIRV